MTEEQIILLINILGEERIFLEKLKDRLHCGFLTNIEGLHQIVKTKCCYNSTILYDLQYNKSFDFHEEDLNYLKSIVEMRYKMQRLLVEKFKNQVWWSEGRPKDATSESLENGVPEEYLEERDKFKDLFEAL